MDQLFTIRVAQSRDGTSWEVPDLNVMEFDPEYEEERNNILLEDAILEGLFVDNGSGRRRSGRRSCLTGARGRPTPAPVRELRRFTRRMTVFIGPTRRISKSPPSTLMGDCPGGPIVWVPSAARFLDCGRALESQNLVRWSAARPELVSVTRPAGSGGVTFQYEGRWLEWVDPGSGGSIRPAGQGGSKTGAPASGAPACWTGLTGLHTTGGPVVAGDELRFYRVRALRSAPASAEDFVTELFSLRRDGFAALQAGDTPGRVVTRPLVLGSGSTLWVNGETASGGGLKAVVAGARWSRGGRVRAESLGPDYRRWNPGPAELVRPGSGSPPDPSRTAGVPAESCRPLCVLDRIINEVKPMKYSRLSVLVLILAVGSSISTGAAQQGASPAAPYEAMIPDSKVGLSPSYGSLIPLRDGRLLWVWGTGRARKPLQPFHKNFSTDGGRTWSDPTPLKLASGEPITGVFNANLVRLRSGKLGLFVTPDVRPDRIAFHVSSDEGETWSEGVPVGTPPVYTTGDKAIVLKTGRIVMPVYGGLTGPKLPSAKPKMNIHGDQFGLNGINGFWYSYTFSSDDEGRTWKRSTNEVFLLYEKGTKGIVRRGRTLAGRTQGWACDDVPATEFDARVPLGVARWRRYLARAGTDLPGFAAGSGVARPDTLDRRSARGLAAGLQLRRDDRSLPPPSQPLPSARMTGKPGRIIATWNRSTTPRSLKGRWSRR